MNSTDNYGDLPINMAMKEYPDQGKFRRGGGRDASLPMVISFLSFSSFACIIISDIKQRVECDIYAFY